MTPVTPGEGNLIAGATALNYTHTGRTTGTRY